MTIDEAERKKPINFAKHVWQKVKEHGKELFVYGSNIIPVQNEFALAICNKEKSVIVPDGREDKQSSHLCLFLSSGTNKLVVLAIYIHSDTIDVLTMFPAKSNPSGLWFFNCYNKIAAQRGLPIATSL